MNGVLKYNFKPSSNIPPTDWHVVIHLYFSLQPPFTIHSIHLMSYNVSKVPTQVHNKIPLRKEKTRRCNKNQLVLLKMFALNG